MKKTANSWPVFAGIGSHQKWAFFCTLSKCLGFYQVVHGVSNNAMVPHVPWVSHMLSSVVTSISLAKKLKRATNKGLD
jgi:hypothetical protein